MARHGAYIPVRFVSLVRRLRTIWPLALWELVVGLGAASILTVLFVGLGHYVVRPERLDFDRTVSSVVYSFANPTLTAALLLLTNLAAAIVTVPLFALMVGYLMAHRRIHAAALVVVSGRGAAISDPLLKGIYQRTRPDLIVPLDVAGGYSFPSGHAVMAVVTFGLLAYLVGRRLTKWARVLVTAVAAAVILLVVAFTRVYLGVHYPTDVMGSLLVGGAWLIATILALRRVGLPDGAYLRRTPRFPTKA